ncbi:MAG: hypothetical protein ACRCUT_03530, partial [Spirochaetota bacterium]
WGKFKLSLHSWTEPMEIIHDAGKRIKIITPVAGSVISAETPTPLWWQLKIEERKLSMRPDLNRTDAAAEK